MKRAMITGITGQDGSYLAELLLSKGYEVHGIIRRSSSPSLSRIQHLCKDPYSGENGLILHCGDMTDSSSIHSLVEKIQPHEVYNLAAQSHVRISFDQPEYTLEVNALGNLRLLESIRRSCPKARYYQASTSEMFGSAPPPQSEATPFRPRSPYACSKVLAFHQVVNYREAYGLFACNGILFNHESPRRGEEFVTRKITRAAGRIAEGLQKKLYLGNLDAKRDWGFAPDYVQAMWLMLQAQEPVDLVIATGESHSVREFLEIAFDEVGLDWKGHVELDSQHVRPSEVEALCGDASKARETLGWVPTLKFDNLVTLMAVSDLELARSEKNGFQPVPLGT